MPATRQDPKMNTSASSSLRLSTRWSSTLVLVFVAGSVAVHPAQLSFNPFDVALSFYMNRALGWLVGFGLISLGGGSLLLGVAIVEACGGRYFKRSLALLILWAAGCIVGGLFRLTPTALGAALRRSPVSHMGSRPWWPSCPSPVRHSPSRDCRVSREPLTALWFDEWPSSPQ